MAYLFLIRNRFLSFHSHVDRWLTGANCCSGKKKKKKLERITRVRTVTTLPSPGTRLRVYLLLDTRRIYKASSDFGTVDKPTVATDNENAITRSDSVVKRHRFMWLLRRRTVGNGTKYFGFPKRIHTGTSTTITR